VKTRYVARSAAEMDRLRNVWESLYRSADHTIFQTFAWNRLAAAHFGREAPFVSFFEDENGAALVPAAVTERSRVTILGERLFDYRDVLTVGDTAALAEAWRPIAELGFPLSVTAVRGRSADRWSFAGLLPFCAAPVVRRCDATADIIEANHRKLGRFSRRLRKQGLELRTHDGSSSVLLRWIYQEKARQFRGGNDNIFADERRAEFIVAVAALKPASCEIFTYQRGSRVIAALVTFRDGDVRRFYTVWFDSAWAKESPGQVLVYEATVDALRNGLDCDYMTGEQPHKARLATSSEQLYRVELSAEELREAVERISLPATEAA
jgi:CelD/BcsL family acetyltransferase involved in cellulose biosynthesis